MEGIIEETELFLDTLLDYIKENFKEYNKLEDRPDLVSKMIIKKALKNLKKDIRLIKITIEYLRRKKYEEALGLLEKIIEILKNLKIEEDKYFIIILCEKYLKKTIQGF